MRALTNPSGIKTSPCLVLHSNMELCIVYPLISRHIVPYVEVGWFQLPFLLCIAFLRFVTIGCCICLISPVFGILDGQPILRTTFVRTFSSDRCWVHVSVFSILHKQYNVIEMDSLDHYVKIVLVHVNFALCSFHFVFCYFYLLAMVLPRTGSFLPSHGTCLLSAFELNFCNTLNPIINDEVLQFSAQTVESSHLHSYFFWLFRGQ